MEKLITDLMVALSPMIFCLPFVGMCHAEETSAPSNGKVFELPALPFGPNALEPYISAGTLSFHHGKHHQTYVDNLNKLIAGTSMQGSTLESIILSAQGNADKAAVFNNAAQIWNHTFFWNSMKQGGGGKPSGTLMRMIDESFGSYDQFKEQFLASAVSVFGSGWTWLIQDGSTLKISKTSNADTPVAHGQIALLTCDVWEHAYYLDYQNRRKDFVEAFLNHLVNWDFAASQLK